MPSIFFLWREEVTFVHLQLTTMDTLKELFPHIKDHELERYLNSAADDLDLCISMILSDTDNLSNHNVSDMGEEQTLTSLNELEELKLMFPKLDPTLIESIYRDENERISNVITHLLNLEYIHNETSGEGFAPPTLLGAQNTFKQSTRSKNQWQNTYNNIDILANLLNWTSDQSLLIQLYHENQFSTIKTLIYIILKQIHPPRLPVSTSSTSNSTLRGKKFSKVQNNTGFAHNTDKNKGKNNKIGRIDSRSSINRQLSGTMNMNVNLYISYDEYLSLIKQDKHCDGINPQFVLKLFEYFQSNESQTSFQNCHKILQYILDDPNGITLTFSKYDNETSWNSVSNISKKNTTTIKSSSNIHNSTGIEPTYRDPTIDDVFETYKLDFHGFTPQHAVVVLNNIINKWWDEELKLRELNNYNMKQQSVTCLEPLTLITGRGIHSVGGKSPVRFQVKRYLQLNGYLFNEEPSYFEVYGKQRKESRKK